MRSVLFYQIENLHRLDKCGNSQIENLPSSEQIPWHKTGHNVEEFHNATNIDKCTDHVSAWSGYLSNELMKLHGLMATFHINHNLSAQ